MKKIINLVKNVYNWFTNQLKNVNNLFTYGLFAIAILSIIPPIRNIAFLIGVILMFIKEAIKWCKEPNRKWQWNKILSFTYGAIFMQLLIYIMEIELC